MALILDASAEESAETGALVRDLVEWIAQQPRAYGEVMDACRTSCPRLPVWVTACDRHYLARLDGQMRVTQTGLDMLEAAHRR